MHYVYFLFILFSSNKLVKAKIKEISLPLLVFSRAASPFGGVLVLASKPYLCPPVKMAT
jgi:hypothetical protein